MLKEFSCWSIRYNTGILIYKIQSKCRSDYSPYGTKFTRSTIFTLFADKFSTAGGIVFIHAPLPPHWSFRLSSLDYTSSTRFAPLKSFSVGMTPQYYQTCQVSRIWREIHAFDCHVTLTHISVPDLTPFPDSHSLSHSL